MFRATIELDDGNPFRFSGQPVPYDLQILRQHVLARAGRVRQVELRLARDQRAAVASVLRELEGRGVRVVLRP